MITNTRQFYDAMGTVTDNSGNKYIPTISSSTKEYGFIGKIEVIGDYMFATDISNVRITKYNKNNLEKIKEVNIPFNAVMDFKIYKDKIYCACVSCGTYGGIAIFDTDLQLIKKIDGDFDRPHVVDSIEVNDDYIFLDGYLEHKVFVFSNRTYEKLWETEVQAGRGQGLLLHNNILYRSELEINKISMFDINTRKKIGESQTLNSTPQHLKFYNNYLYLVTYTNEEARIIEMNLQGSIIKEKLISGVTKGITDFNFYNNEIYLAWTGDSSVKILDFDFNEIGTKAFPSDEFRSNIVFYGNQVFCGMNHSIFKLYASNFNLISKTKPERYVGVKLTDYRMIE